MANYIASADELVSTAYETVVDGVISRNMYFIMRGS
jgi:hypothetical protein